MDKKTRKHKEIWNKKKIIRIIYKEWYKKIINDLFEKNTGKTLELGSGTGNFKSYKPDIISSDIEELEWLDMRFDAHNMPFKNNELLNIVMIDVLHHLYDPILFFNEAYRVLKKSGRIIIIEPFPTIFSYLIYRIFHPEPFIFDIDYFNQIGNKNKDPWDSNQAISYLIFFKNIKKFNKFFSYKFNIKKKIKFCCILYPLSGGFENKSLIPNFLIPFFQFLEFCLIPLRFIFAFRSYIVLEKK